MAWFRGEENAEARAILLLLVRGLEDKTAEQDRILAMANLMSVSVGQPRWCLYVTAATTAKYPKDRLSLLLRVKAR